MKPASRTPVLDIFRLHPAGDVSLTHMLICREASLLAAAAPSGTPATAADEARFWLDAALEEDRARAFYDPGRYLN
jgi:hypothetical protein